MQFPDPDQGQVIRHEALEQEPSRSARSKYSSGSRSWPGFASDPHFAAHISSVMRMTRTEPGCARSLDRALTLFFMSLTLLGASQPM